MEAVQLPAHVTPNDGADADLRDQSLAPGSAASRSREREASRSSPHFQHVVRLAGERCASSTSARGARGFERSERFAALIGQCHATNTVDGLPRAAGDNPRDSTMKPGPRAASRGERRRPRTAYAAAQLFAWPRNSRLEFQGSCDQCRHSSPRVRSFHG